MIRFAIEFLVATALGAIMQQGFALLVARQAARREYLRRAGLCDRCGWPPKDCACNSWYGGAW